MNTPWLFQEPKQKAKLGDKTPWCVGWYDSGGKRKQKSVGSKSSAEKYRRKLEGELAAGLSKDRRRVKWDEFRKAFSANGLTGKRPGTKTQYENALDSFERVAKPKYMDGVTSLAIDGFKAARLGEGRRPTSKPKNPDRPARNRNPNRPKGRVRTGPLSVASVNKEMRHLRAAFRKAKKWGMLATAPDFDFLREDERDPYYIDDATFKKLYDACDTMTRPAGRHYPSADWWKALLCFAYMTGWRIGEIRALKRADLDLDKGVATVGGDKTKGRRAARIELHAAVVEHLRAIDGDGDDQAFEWPYVARALWEDFAKLKTAAGVTFPGAFHKFRFGFANANVDELDADLLQQLMRHRSAATTRGYIHAANRLRRSGVAERIHAPAFLKKPER